MRKNSTDFASRYFPNLDGVAIDSSPFKYLSACGSAIS